MRRQKVFLYLPISRTHFPNLPSKRFEGQSRIGQFGDSLMEGDAIVGKMLDALYELLRGTADLPAAVVALGGGTFTFAENVDFVKEHGVSVFLDVPFDALAARIRDKSDRPLFRSVDEARLLYEARHPWYNMASWAISVSEGEDVGTVVDRVEVSERGGSDWVRLTKRIDTGEVGAA